MLIISFALFLSHIHKHIVQLWEDDTSRTLYSKDVSNKSSSENRYINRT